MTFKIIWTDDAMRDAEDYMDFVGEHQGAKDAALKWLDGLLKAAANLRQSPDRFAVIPEAIELDAPYRAFNYHSHRVIYSVRHSDQTLTIYRIWHNSRDNLVIPGVL